jgi:hypothetical protein
LGIIFPQLCETVSKSIFVKGIFWIITLLLPCCLKLLESRKCAPESWFFFSGEILLDSIRILMNKLAVAMKARMPQ